MTRLSIASAERHLGCRFAKFNRDLFAGGLPAETRVWLTPAVRSPSRACLANGTILIASSLVTADIADEDFRLRVLDGVLLHECVHLHLRRHWLRAWTHGPVFCAEVNRLGRRLGHRRVGWLPLSRRHCRSWPMSAWKGSILGDAAGLLGAAVREEEDGRPRHHDPLLVNEVGFLDRRLPEPYRSAWRCCRQELHSRGLVPALPVGKDAP